MIIAALKVAVAVGCGYETFSLATRRTPTISVLCGRHRWLTPVIVGGLVAHLPWPRLWRQLAG